MGPHFQNWPTSTFSPSVGPARTNPLQPKTAFSPSWRDKLTVFQSICRDYVHLHKVLWHRSKNAICRLSMSSSVAGYSTVSGSWKWMEQESPWSLVVSLLMTLHPMYMREKWNVWSDRVENVRGVQLAPLDVENQQLWTDEQASALPCSASQFNLHRLIQLTTTYKRGYCC